MLGPAAQIWREITFHDVELVFGQWELSPALVRFRREIARDRSIGTVDKPGETELTHTFGDLGGFVYVPISQARDARDVEEEILQVRVFPFEVFNVDTEGFIHGGIVIASASGQVSDLDGDVGRFR